MRTPLSKKSSIKTIQARFDNEVERFSNIDSGQKAVIDASLLLELVSTLSKKVVPHAQDILDIGCGAGNNTIRIVRENPNLNCDLIDLSLPMLKRAEERLAKEQTGAVRIFQGDFRSLILPKEHYDIIIGAAVLHHLRDDQDWFQTFSKIYSLLKPGGALFVSDLLFHEIEAVQRLMWNNYGEYLIRIGGNQVKQEVFDYIDEEDSPRDITFQIELMRKVGFNKIDILHKNSCFGAYVAIK